MEREKRLLLSVLMVVVVLSALAVVVMAEDEVNETPTPTASPAQQDMIVGGAIIVLCIVFIILFIIIPVIGIHYVHKQGAIYNEALGLPKGSVRAIMAFGLIICVFIMLILSNGESNEVITALLAILASIVAYYFAQKSAVPPTATPAVSKLAFTTPAQKIKKNQVSNVMIIQAQDTAGTPINLAADTTICLTSTSPDGKFSLASDPWSDVPDICVPGGKNSANFYYRDTRTATIIAVESPSKGWAAAQQKVIISNNSESKSA
jgi:hypothetical protein